MKSRYERIRVVLIEWGMMLGDPVTGLSHSPISRTGAMMESGPDGMQVHSSTPRVPTCRRYRNAMRTHRVMLELDDLTFNSQRWQYDTRELKTESQVAVMLGVSESAVHLMGVKAAEHLARRLNLDQPTYDIREDRAPGVKVPYKPRPNLYRRRPAVQQTRMRYNQHRPILTKRGKQG